jgi:hypothetical protein
VKRESVPVRLPTMGAGRSFARACSRQVWCIRPAAGSLLMAGMLALLPATRLAAQECLRPTGTRSNWSALGAGVAEGSHTAATLELGRNFLPDLAVLAEVDALTWNDGGDALPKRRSIRLAGAYRFHEAKKEGNVLDALALCVTASPEHVQVGDVSIVHVPVGLVVATEWRSASGLWRVVPHVEPRIGYRRATLLEFSQSSSAVQVRAGLGAGFDRYFGGVTFHRPIGSDPSSSGTIISGDAWTARLRFGIEF